MFLDTCSDRISDRTTKQRRTLYIAPKYPNTPGSAPADPKFCAKPNLRPESCRLPTMTNYYGPKRAIWVSKSNSALRVVGPNRYSKCPQNSDQGHAGSITITWDEVWVTFQSGGFNRVQKHAVVSHDTGTTEVALY